MIKGIGNSPYFNLESHLNMSEFKQLQPEIYKGISEAREFAKEGTWMKPGYDLKNMSYKIHWKPIYQAVEEYLALPDDDPIKKEGWDLYSNIKDYTTRNKFTRYLKIALGAYDPYIYYFLWEEGSWDDRTGKRKLTEESKFFPNTVKWIENLITTNIFKHIGRVLIFLCDSNGIPFEHRDLGAHKGVLTDNSYFPHKNEFIHLRPNTKKSFYLWDPETNNKVHINSTAAWWNDQDWHGGDIIIEQSYSIRIDGEFTEEFRKTLGIDHLDSY